MDRFHELRIFIAVAETGGFAKAAGALHASPPAVTRAVAALEDRLGVLLFNRTTRKVHLTEAGTRFREDARRVLNDLDAAEQDVKGQSRFAHWRDLGHRVPRVRPDSSAASRRRLRRRPPEGQRLAAAARPHRRSRRRGLRSGRAHRQHAQLIADGEPHRRGSPHAGCKPGLSRKPEHTEQAARSQGTRHYCAHDADERSRVALCRWKPVGASEVDATHRYE